MSNKLKLVVLLSFLAMSTVITIRATELSLELELDQAANRMDDFATDLGRAQELTAASHDQHVR
jgi:hypothetical protein